MQIQIMRNRILSVILTICLILTMMPVTVCSDDTPDTTPPSFNDGPKEYYKEGNGSKRLVLTTGPLSESAFIYFVVVAKGSGKPSTEQIKKGLDSIGKAALYSGGTTEHMTTNAIYNFSFPMAEDNMEYDAYFLLEDASGNKTLSDTLTVKTPEERPDPICEIIGGDKYKKIEDAISTVLASGGGTIKLLDHVYHYKPVKLNVSGNIIFDLNGKYFSIYTGHLDSPSGLAALVVSDGCKVSYINGGKDSKFDITGYEYGVKVIGSGSSATVNYARSIGESGIAAATGPGSSIVINGNVRAGKYSTGVWSNGIVTVNGNIEVDEEGGEGVYADLGGTIIVNGDVEVTGDRSTGAWSYGSVIINGNIAASGEHTYGAYASGEDAQIDVHGKISVSKGNSIGALAANGGEISVTNAGTAISMSGDFSCGVNVRNQDKSKVTVNGNIEAVGDDACGINANIGEVIVNGNITVEESFVTGVSASDLGTVYVYGNITATGREAAGVYATIGEGAGGIVYVNGNVNVSSSDDDSIGIRCYSRETSSEDHKSTVTVDGKVNADDTYILIDNIIRTIDSKNIIESGYFVYNGEKGSIVKVGNGAVEPPVNLPAVATNMVTDITTSSAILSGNVTSDGGNTVTERGFLFGTDSGLTTSTAINVGSGTGIFTTSVTELEEGKTYYVRAYAVNSKGTGYGAIVSFDTSDTPVTPPPSPKGSSSRSLPTVVTKSVSNITESGASLSGSVTSDGGATVTERGFVYSQNKNPSVGGSGVVKITSGKGTGSFTALAEGLEADTTYHVRAYAVNSVGTSYGEDISFTTKKAYVPAGEIGWLDASGIDLSNPYGNVVLYTDEDGEQHILGLGIILGNRMKYVSRGQGKYEIIYNAKPFEDIADHWAKNDIDFSSARLLFNGVTPRIFSPDTHMTRGMFAAVLGRMYGAAPDYYTGYSFEDVTQDMYYAPYIKWAAENGIIMGVSARLFEPERAVTRQEMAAMVYRFMKYLDLSFTNGNNKFNDDALIDSWARESIMQLKGTGIISGRTDNKFDPYGLSTRAEVASVLRMLIEYILK